jgi:hypothetical protein
LGDQIGSNRGESEPSGIETPEVATEIQHASAGWQVIQGFMHLFTLFQRKSHK